MEFKLLLSKIISAAKATIGDISTPTPLPSISRPERGAEQSLALIRANHPPTTLPSSSSHHPPTTPSSSPKQVAPATAPRDGLWAIPQSQIFPTPDVHSKCTSDKGKGLVIKTHLYHITDHLSSSDTPPPTFCRASRGLTLGNGPLHKYAAQRSAEELASAKAAEQVKWDASMAQGRAIIERLLARQAAQRAAMHPTTLLHPQPLSMATTNAIIAMVTTFGGDAPDESF